MGSYAIIEKKNNDCYVIYDMENKGMCCCSKYTMVQLIDRGSKILGVCLNQGKMFIGVRTKEGKPVDRERKYDVALTKRSAVTIERGIKPTREEVNRQKEIQVKRKETRNENKKEMELKKKEEAKRIALMEKKNKEIEREMGKAEKRVMKSKCIAILEKIDIEASEYDYKEEYLYTLIALTSSGLTAMRKLDKEQSRVNRGFYIRENASKILERFGKYVTTARLRIELNDGDIEGIQAVIGREVRVIYMNYYSDIRVFAEFSRRNSYIAKVLDCKGVYEGEAKDFELGASAGGGSTLNGLSKWMRRSGYVNI